MLRRLSDLIGSALLLLLASPVFLITAIAVWLSDPGPVLFKQSRAGWMGRPFEILKFRSMRLNNLPTDSPEEIGEGKGHPLVTPVGRWIRRFKVDELPQLFNVLFGQMSFIGPRPPMLDDLKSYTNFQRRRLNVPPGMTGWAQVNGGAEISWPERIILEVWYVDHRSFWLDLLILWRTITVIVLGHQSNPRALQRALAYALRIAAPEELELPPRTYRRANAILDGADASGDEHGEELSDVMGGDSWRRSG